VREHEFDTDAGSVWVAVGPTGYLQRGDGRVAAWIRGDAGDGNRRRAPLHDEGAGAALEASRDGLTIARGPYGGSSLYYAEARGTVLVSSQLAPLIDALAEPPALDVEGLAWLAVAKIRPDARATIYHGVRRVLPCETVTFGADETRCSFTLPRVPSRLPRDAEGHAILLRDCLSRILAREVGRFSAVAVSAGGGLDSSGLLALVARHVAAHGGPFFTGLTLDFAGPGDDRPHMVALLRMLGAETLRVSPREVGPIPSQFFVQDAAPFHWPTSPLETLAGRRAKAWGAMAVVTGVGGDQALDGDFGSFARRVRQGDLRALIDVARLRVPWRSSARVRLRDYVGKPLLRAWMPTSIRRAWRGRQQLDVVPWAGRRLQPVLEAFATRPLEPEEEWQTAYALSHQLMLVADGRTQEESACGLPRIDPYLDPTFIELVASLPPEELFFGGRTRGLFRHAMVGLLPESLRLRQDKASFEPMINEVFAVASKSPGLRELLTMEATADLGLVEPRPFREQLDRVIRGEPTVGGWLSVWPMIAIEGFVRTIEAHRETPVDNDRD